jgi:hypothetical protein
MILDYEYSILPRTVLLFGSETAINHTPHQRDFSVFDMNANRCLKNRWVTRKALTHIKPTLPSDVQEIPYIHRTDICISVFTETRQWSLSQTSRINSTAQSFQILFNITLPSMRTSPNTFSSLHALRLKFRCTFICAMRATCTTPPPTQQRTEPTLQITALQRTVTSAASS